MTLSPIAAWILTFLIHSTVLTGLALLCLKVLRGPAARVVVLRSALLGAFVTTTIAGLSTGGEQWVLPATSEARRIISVDSAGMAPIVDRGLPVASDGVTETKLNAVDPVSLSDKAWTTLPVLLCLFGFLGVVRLTFREKAAWRLLRDRKKLELPTLRKSARCLTVNHKLKRELRLTTSTRIDVPMALGRREIVLPEKAMIQLNSEQLEALLAHEIGHLVRRDPMWLGTGRVAVALAWFQPLQRLLIRRLEEETELAADDWATERIGDGLNLAVCLERVGSWLVESPTPVSTAAMASRGSSLVARVERLVATGPKENKRLVVLAAVASVTALGVFACIGPAVTPEEPSSSQPPSEADIIVAEILPADEAAPSEAMHIRISVTEPGHQLLYKAGSFKTSETQELAKWLKRNRANTSLDGAVLHADAGTVMADITPVLDAAVAAGYTVVTFGGATADRGEEWTERYNEEALPKEPQATEASKDTTTIQLDADGFITTYNITAYNGHGGAFSGRARFGKHLFTLLKKGAVRLPEGALVIQVDKDTSFKHVQQIMELCATREVQISGIHVGLISDPSYLTDFSLPTGEEVAKFEEEDEEDSSNSKSPAPFSEADSHLLVSIRPNANDNTQITTEWSSLRFSGQIDSNKGMTGIIEADCNPNAPMGNLLPLLHRLTQEGARLVFVASTSQGDNN